MASICYPSFKVYVPIAKIENYLLNEAGNHYTAFKAEGYKPGDGYKLSRKLEQGYDRSKAIDFDYGTGYTQYSIIMEFGGYAARTVWREDRISHLPRFITAYIDRRVEHG